MKKAIAMILTAALAATTANAINWTGNAGTGLLETPGNWANAMSASSSAEFRLDQPTAIWTQTGFTNAATTFNLTNCAVTIAVPPGLAYAMTSFTLRTAR